jgi:hypothetical protein
LIALRRQYAALRHGDYRELYVSHQQFAFVRSVPPSSVVVVVNAAAHEAQVSLLLAELSGRCLEDVLNGGAPIPVTAGRCQMSVAPGWGRVLVCR